MSDYKRARSSAFNTQSRIVQSMQEVPAFLATISTDRHYADSLFACALIAVMPLLRIGYSVDNLATLLTHLRVSDLRQAIDQSQHNGTDLVLTCPIHFAVTAPQYHYMCMPNACTNDWARLERFSRSVGKTSAKGWLLAHPDGTELLKPRFNWVKKELRSAFKTIVRRYQRGGCAYVSKLTLNQFSQALCNLAITEQGIAPAYITLRQTSPLPVDATPTSYQLLKGVMLPPISEREWHSLASLKNEQSYADTQLSFGEYLKQRQPDHRSLYHGAIVKLERTEDGIQKTLPEEALSASILASNTPDNRGPNYLDTCKDAIDRYFEELFKFQTNKRLSKLQAKRFWDIALKLLWQLELQIYPYSLTLLSLGWVTELVCKAKINPETALKYINQLTRRTGLYFELSHDLRLWDDDDFEQFIGFIDYRLGGGQSTKQSRARQILRFFRFCGSMGLLQDVGIPMLTEGYVTTRKRNQLIEPARINQFVSSCAARSNPRSHATLCGTILCYYAGLRHDEFARLRLSRLHHYDALYDTGEFGEGSIEKLRVKVARGKTINAPRSVYLHLFAPADVQNHLLQAISDRRDLYPKAHPANIRLTGLHNDRLGYRSSGLKKSLLKQLKAYFGHNIDVHTLRHCFATWLLLAYELAKQPKLAEFLNIPSGSPLFEEQGLNALLKFCDWAAGNFDIHHQPHHFAILANLIGHGDIQTTFQHYFHGHCVIARMHLHQLFTGSN